jgi:hypothetical protein
MLEKHFGEEIIEMHFVEHFNVLKITKKLMQQVLKLCNVFFVTIIQY